MTFLLKIGATYKLNTLCHVKMGELDFKLSKNLKLKRMSEELGARTGSSVALLYQVNMWAGIGFMSVEDREEMRMKITHRSPTSLLRTKARPDPLFVLCEVKPQQCLCKCHAKHLVQSAIMISSKSHLKKCNSIRKHNSVEKYRQPNEALLISKGILGIIMDRLTFQEISKILLLFWLFHNACYCLMMKQGCSFIISLVLPVNLFRM